MNSHFIRYFLSLVIVFCIINSRHAICQRYPSHIPYYDNGKWGYCDSNKKVLIAPQWDDVEFFRNGRAKVGFREHAFDGNRHSCIIDTKGNYIIPPERYWTGVEIWEQLDAKRTTFKSPSQTSYEHILQSRFLRNAIDTSLKTFGIIDANNNIIIPLVYDNESNSEFFYDKQTNKRYFLGARNRKYGLIDLDLKTVIPFEYDQMTMENVLVSGDTIVFFITVADNKYGA